MKKQHLIIISVLLVSACAGSVEKADYNPTPHDSPSGEGLFSGNNGNLLDVFSSAEKGSFLGVNSYLWRASLEAISFMPLIQADSSGGVLLTDWFTSTDKTNERVKANVYILGKTLRPQNLKVTLFKQKKTKNGWEDISTSAQTVRKLEDTILTKARLLRVQADQ